jgi:AcrR family transcriptional regulator
MISINRNVERTNFVGLRERNKEDKFDRIRSSTLEVLAEKGFSETTIREISRRAGVGHGTIFSYAPNKIELCLMSITDGLDLTAERTFASLDQHLPLVDQLIEFFRSRYLFWDRHRELFFAATQQLSGGYMDGSPPELDRAKARRAHTRGYVLEILSRGHNSGDIRKNLALDKMASIILDIYLQELRFWLNDDAVGLEEGLDHLRSLLDALIELISQRQRNSPSLRP